MQVSECRLVVHAESIVKSGQNVLTVPFAFRLVDNELELIDFPIVLMEAIGLAGQLFITDSNRTSVLPNEMGIEVVKYLSVEFFSIVSNGSSVRSLAKNEGIRVTLEFGGNSEMIFEGRISMVSVEVRL